MHGVQWFSFGNQVATKRLCEKVRLVNARLAEWIGSGYRGTGMFPFFIRSAPVQAGSGLLSMAIMVKEF